MKKISFLVILVVSVFSCSSYNVKTEVESGSGLSKLKASGIIFRNYKHSLMSNNDYSSNFTRWLEGHKRINKLSIITGVSNSAGIFDGTGDRFYQHSVNDRFLKYKSIGMIKLYVRDNENELKKLMREKNLDSLVIYEVNSGFSKEMLIFDMETVIVILNRNLKLIYLDHQRDSYPEKEVVRWDTIMTGKVKGDYDNYSGEMLKNALLDKISHRFIEVLDGLDFIEDID
jgi:hypothetical protein